MKRIIYCIILIFSIIISVFTLSKSSSFDKSEAENELLFGLQEGYIYRYSMEYNSSGKGNTSILADIEAKDRPEHEIALLCAGDLELMILEDSNDYEIKLTIKPKKFQMQGNHIAPKHNLGPITANFVWEQNGNIKEYRMESSQYQKDSFLIREILSYIELPVVNQKGAVWEANEQGFGHDNMVTIKIVDASNDENIRLLKSYRNQPSGETKLDGGFDFRFDNIKGHIVAISGEKQQVIRTKNRLLSDTQTSFKLKLLSITKASLSDQVTKEFKKDKEPMMVDTLSGDLAKKLMKRNTYLSILGPETAESLLIKTMSIDASNKEQRNEVFNKLSALFSAYPDSVYKYLEFLNNNDFNNHALSVLMSALIYTGTSEVQDVLRQVIAQSMGDEKKVERMLTGLTFMDYPDIKTEEFVRELTETATSDRIRLVASYAMGNIGHFLRKHEPERSKKILGEYAQKLTDADGSDNDVYNYLAIIGNIGIKEQLEPVAKYLTNSSKKVRLKAYNALRFIDDDDAREYLIEGLSDKDAGIREIAAKSLSFTPGTTRTLSVYSERLHIETNTTVLKSIIENLARMSTTYPKSVAILDGFIADCGKTDVCNYAVGIRSSI